MTDEKKKIVMIYSVVAVLCVLILVVTTLIRGTAVEPEFVVAETGPMLKLEKDIDLVRQDGEAVKLSDLKGKVWAFAQFYATCPMCAKRNAQGLKDVYERFKGEEDFVMVCITVNPEEDTAESMASYAEMLGADVSNWWFLTGDAAELKSYMVDEIKYDPIQVREDEAEAAAKGKLMHNMSLAVFNRDMEMMGRRDLYQAKLMGEGVYAETLKTFNGMVEQELGR